MNVRRAVTEALIRILNRQLRIHGVYDMTVIALSLDFTMAMVVHSGTKRMVGVVPAETLLAN